MQKLMVLFTLAALTAGCRADVDGWWEGTIGDSAATLSIDQAGSKISGEVCLSAGCTDIDEGRLEESELVIKYSCGSCVLPDSVLLLQVYENRLEGDAQIEGPGCPAGQPSCKLAVALHRCSGPCGSPQYPDTGSGGGGEDGGGGAGCGGSTTISSGGGGGSAAGGSGGAGGAAAAAGGGGSGGA